MSMSNIPTAAPRWHHRVRQYGAKLRNDTQGVAMIEAAFCLPTLLFISLAGIETANMMVTHTRISAIALIVLTA